MRSHARLGLALAALTVGGCAAHSANPAAESAVPAGNARQPVAAVDESGDLILSGGTSDSRVDDARWLAGLRRDDLLRFSVVIGEAQPVSVGYRLSRLERRGHSVAALFEPEPAPDYPGVLTPYWLAGNDEALWRLDHHPQLIEPGFVPLAADGRVLLDPRQGAALWLSTRWQDQSAEERGPDQGWVIEELSMTLEGPVRGDRCARLSRVEGGQVVVVCGDVGVVQLERGGLGPAAEHWQLVEIRR
jgi:hypothetical protein